MNATCVCVCVCVCELMAGHAVKTGTDLYEALSHIERLTETALRRISGDVGKRRAIRPRGFGKGKRETTCSHIRITNPSCTVPKRSAKATIGRRQLRRIDEEKGVKSKERVWESRLLR